MHVLSFTFARRVFLILPVLGSCASPPPNEIYGLWRIDQARIEPIVDRSQARLDFGRDGTLIGHTSCNTLRATYTLDGANLRIGPIVATRMACGPLLMEQEDRILSALEIAATARVRQDGLLELREIEGRGVLRGTRFAPEVPGHSPKAVLE
jgi:heat shock protein HslJ